MNPGEKPAGLSSQVRIVVDADGCPVKDEVARVAKRLDLPVIFVANRSMRIPQGKGFRLEVVPELFDAADDWIAENCDEKTVVVCGDIPLASRCVAAGATSSIPGVEFSMRNRWGRRWLAGISRHT